VRVILEALIGLVEGRALVVVEAVRMIIEAP
jgi:hypothetical protein